MSYPRDLDEIDDAELHEEIARRSEARSSGLCDYCGLPEGTSPCRFPKRHAMAMPTDAADKALTDGGDNGR